MHDIAKYSPKELNEFWSKLMLAIHSEFCYNQRDYNKWKAGMDVIQEIGGHYKANE
jgi:hypothetical protein